MATDETGVVVGQGHGQPIEPAGTIDERIYVASQTQLMWWKFRKHKAAVLSAVLLIGLYAIAIFAEFVAPYDPNKYDVRYSYAPPQLPQFIDPDGAFSMRPFVYGLKQERDPVTMRLMFELDTEQKYYLRLWTRGVPYKMWGLVDSNLHLFGLDDPDQIFFVLGADRMGRDMFSRIVYGTRISMSVGLVGVLVSLVLGLIIGGVSGYYGGAIDNAIQRIIEFIRSIPTIPLWMALSAAVPKEWPPLRVYFVIVVLLSFIGWTSLARVVRGRFLSLRNEDFVMAARLQGASEMRVILRHMVPAFASHIIASLTLSIPGMILSETSLSFLGLGLRPPVISWGVLLQESQNLRAVATASWLLLPGLAVVLAVLGFNFVGDGMRDAADPYSR
ncbi:MAG: ABC transporter permease [Chloroflexi bacterium]|nr:ABC transporter permease [Chloroflexota bacterium]